MISTARCASAAMRWLIRRASSTSGTARSSHANADRAVHRDRGKRLVQFVRDGRRQFSQHRDTRRVREVRLEPLQHVLGANALGQVDQADERDAQIRCRTGASGRSSRTSIIRPSSVAQPGRFLEDRFSAIAALERAPKACRDSPSRPTAEEPSNALPVSGAEHLSRMVVDLFDDKHFHRTVQPVGDGR